MIGALYVSKAVLELMVNGKHVTCERADYDYYNRYRPRNISELHGLSTVTCSLLTLDVGIDIVVMASIKPQMYSRIPTVSYPSNSSIYAQTDFPSATVHETSS